MIEIKAPHEAEIHARIATFAQNIRLLRKELGWSRNDLAREAGVSSKCIAMIEVGRNGPTLTVALAIATALEASAGRSLDDLLTPGMGK